MDYGNKKLELVLMLVVIEINIVGLRKHLSNAIKSNILASETYLEVYHKTSTSER